MRELVALAHERRVPVLIHAGRGIPALGRDTVRAVRRVPGRAADPRARGDLRPRLAVARAARPPEPVHRHRVVGPGGHDGAVHARRRRANIAVGERLAVRAPAHVRGPAPAARRPGGPRRAGAARRSRAGRSSDCSTAASRSTPARRPAAARPIDPLLERVVSHSAQAIARTFGAGDPVRAGRARPARLRRSARTARTRACSRRCSSCSTSTRRTSRAVAGGPAHTRSRRGCCWRRARSRARPTCRCPRRSRSGCRTGRRRGRRRALGAPRRHRRGRA